MAKIKSGLRDFKDRDVTAVFNFWSPANTLILIKDNGEARFASNKGDKSSIISEYNEEVDSLIIIWAGQWENDPFLIDREDLAKYAHN